MTETQIKEYLNKYSLTTKEKLAEHITQLKRNTKPNLELVSELNYVLVDEENLFFNVFSREKDNHKEQINNSVYLYNVSSLSDGNTIRGEKIVGDLECVNKPPQKRLTLHIENVINDAQQEKKSAMFLDEVLAQKENTKGHSTRLKANNPLIVSEKGEELVFDKDCNLKANTPMEEAPLGYFGKRGKVIDYSIGKKETQTVEKAPIFTYCKVNKNALEALALRALYGHKKYNIDGADEDWQNFTRVPNGDEEYANANFRHALNIGEETEEEHLISSAWNAVARLEVYFRKNKK